MNEEDLFLNYILLESEKDIKKYINNKSFNLTFENNYAVRFAIKEKKYKMAKIIASDYRVKEIVNIEWIENCIKDEYLKVYLFNLFKEHLFLNYIEDNKYDEVLNFIKDKEFDITFDGNKALIYSIEKNKNKITKILLSDKRVFNFINKDFIDNITNDEVRNKLKLIYNLNKF